MPQLLQAIKTQSEMLRAFILQLAEMPWADKYWWLSALKKIKNRCTNNVS